jgi:hypothetical protein
MFHEKNPQVRKEIAEWIYTIWDIFVGDSNKPDKTANIFYETLIDDYSIRAIKKPEVSEEYYTVVSQIEVLSNLTIVQNRT